MEGDFSGDALNIEEKGGGETNYSLVSISCIDGFLQPSSGEGMFSVESPVKTGDACTTVNEGVGVDSFQGV